MEHKRFGYSWYVRNFDALLERLGASGDKAHEALLAGLTGINETNEVATFNRQISKRLKGAANPERLKNLKYPVESILNNLRADETDFLKE